MSTPVRMGMPDAARSSGEVDARALEAALRRSVRGEVRFDAGSRGAYSTDGSNYRQVPIGVVVPYDADTLVLADGLSCRTQIQQATGRHALHLAEVLRLAMRNQEHHAPKP